MGLLSGKDPALQLQAACCITNFSASDYKHCMMALQHAAPYLVTYLGGQNAVLQVSGAGSVVVAFLGSPDWGSVIS